MGATRGRDFKLYRNTDDPYDSSPTWREVTDVRDLTRGLEKTMADASIRGSEYKLQVSVQKDLSVDFQMVYDPDDVDVQAFEDAFHEDTDVELLFLDGPIDTVGSKGLRGMFQVSKFTGNEALTDVGLNDVTVVPAYFPTNLPRRVHVASPGSVVDS